MCISYIYSVLSRAYIVTTSGPWEELNSVRLLDLAIQPAPTDEDNLELWALATNGEVLRRENVSKNDPCVSFILNEQCGSYKFAMFCWSEFSVLV